jgi:hypothetical protein
MQLVKARKIIMKSYIDIENERSLIGTSGSQEPAVWRELHVLDMSRMCFQVDVSKFPQMIYAGLHGFIVGRVPSRR